MRLNVEAEVVAFLNSKGFQAFAEVPDGKLVPKPKRFVVVEMTSSSTNGIGAGEWSLAIQSWAESRYQASELANEVDRTLFELVDNVRPITNVYRNALYNYPTSEMEPRYQGAYELYGHIDSKED